MLEKKNMNLDVGAAATINFTDKNGNDVVILKRIPFEEKEQMVLELAALTLSADEDTGICYINALYEVMLAYLFVKYYTNIDVEWVKEAADYKRLYDYCAANMLWYSDFCPEDYVLLMTYWNRYSKAVIKLYEAQHSTMHWIKQMVSTDISTDNSETRALIEKLISMKEAYDEKHAKPVQVGGTVLNFAKRPQGK